MNSKVISYITEEVWRQGHDVNTLDGIERVGWMTNAWAYAIEISRTREWTEEGLYLRNILELGQIIEPSKNLGGFRTCFMRVGATSINVAPIDVPKRIADLLADKELSDRPLDFYRAYEEIHPFLDGNGRSGKILLNLLNGSLLDPIFPPADFWGRPILNP